MGWHSWHRHWPCTVSAGLLHSRSRFCASSCIGPLSSVVCAWAWHWAMTRCKSCYLRCDSENFSDGFWGNVAPKAVRQASQLRSLQINSLRVDGPEVQRFTRQVLLLYTWLKARQIMALREIGGLQVLQIRTHVHMFCSQSSLGCRLMQK